VNRHPIVVLVGHCGPDVGMLRSAIRRIAPEATITTADSQSHVDQYRATPGILLINRMLDGDFEYSSGIDLIREFASHGSAPLMLLVSNYEDAQMEAERAGAMPGFGKSALYEEGTAAKIRDAIVRVLE
jgi:hypothetical protein